MADFPGSVDLTRLFLSKAEMSDYEAVSAISEGVYEGHDYLIPHSFPIWIEEERLDPQKRRSLILAYSSSSDGDGDDDEENPQRMVLGFTSFLFQVT